MPGYVSCDADKCVYRGADDEEPLCMANVLYMERDKADGRSVCASYQDYRQLPDYQEVFYKAMRIPGGEGRLPCRGKRVDVAGLVFYAEGHPMAVEHGTAGVTYGATGEYAGILYAVRDRIDEIRKRLERREDMRVEDLPLVEPCESYRAEDGRVYLFRPVKGPEAGHG